MKHADQKKDQTQNLPLGFFIHWRTERTLRQSKAVNRDIFPPSWRSTRNGMNASPIEKLSTGTFSLLVGGPHGTERTLRQSKGCQQGHSPF